MTDREMLELAAKAAGIELGEDRIDCGVSVTDADGRHRNLPQWNPLTDDGDALRLAAHLNIDVLQRLTDPAEVWAQAPMLRTVIEPVDGDRLYATRRAIVRAAAEIGRRQHDTK